MDPQEIKMRRIADIMYMMSKGYTQLQIAVILGLSQSYVKELAEQAIGERNFPWSERKNMTFGELNRIEKRLFQVIDLLEITPDNLELRSEYNQLLKDYSNGCAI